MNRMWLRPLASCVLAALLVAGCRGSSGESEIRASGTLDADADVVVAPQTLLVLDVPVGEGDRVEAGDALVLLDSSIIGTRLAEAEAAEAAARARREQLIEGARAEEVRAARAALAQAQAQRDGAREGWDILRSYADSLASRGATGLEAARSAAASAESAFRQADAAVTAAQSGLDLLLAGAPAADLLASDAAVEQAHAAVVALQSQVDDLTLRAPRSGVVLERTIEPGEVAQQGAALLRLADLDTLTLVVYVPEDRLGDVSIGQKVTVDTDTSDATYRGTVESIAEQPEFTPRNVQTQDQRASLVFAVTVAVDNADGDLRVGLPADAVIEVD